MGSKKAEISTGIDEQMVALFWFGFFNNVTLPHLSEALLVLPLMKVGTDLLLLHSCVLIFISEC